MPYSGPAFSQRAGDGIVELKFDLAGRIVNSSTRPRCVTSDAATQAIAKDASVNGVIVTSGKPVSSRRRHHRVAGGMFAAGEDALVKGLIETTRLVPVQDLPVPTVVAINRRVPAGA